MPALLSGQTLEQPAMVGKAQDKGFLATSCCLCTSNLLWSTSSFSTEILGSFKLSKIHAESPGCWSGSSWCFKSQPNIALEHMWAFSNHPAINMAHLVRSFTHQYSIIYGTLVSRVAFTLSNGSIQHYEVLKAKNKTAKTWLGGIKPALPPLLRVFSLDLMCTSTLLAVIKWNGGFCYYQLL